MSGTTSVPQPTFGPLGFVAPTEQAILAGVLADMQAAFGGNLNPALNTPQGQLASSEAAVIGYVQDLFLYYCNQVDPAYASGRMQDAIGRLYFMTREPATASTVVATCSGRTGTVIPVGAQAVDTSGNIWLAVQSGVIPSGGNVSIEFQCSVTGPIVCAIGALSAIYQSIPGWDSITNPAAGSLGSLVESRAAFEARRQQSVAINAQGSNASVLAAVLAVPNVIDAYVVDNPTATAATIGGVSVNPNSLYVSVAGGTSANIGQAIWSKKSSGCSTQGNSSVAVYDTSYSVPQPSYVINYTVPTSTPIYVAVTCANLQSVPANALSLVQAAVIAAFTGTDGGSRARIGSTLYASRYYAGVNTLWAGIEIISITIGTSPSPTGNTTTMTIAQIPTILASQITLTLV